MKEFKVSVITVCYNAETFIENAIKSVISQTYGNIEYIIVDGNSTDGTMDIVSRYKGKIAKAVSERDNGIYDAMNKGIKMSSGDIIYFLGADDTLYDNNVISDIVVEFNKDFDIDLIYGRVNKTKVPKSILPHIKVYQVKSKKDLLNNGICHQAIFSKKCLLERAGYFDTRYSICADFNWLVSVFGYQGLRVVYINRYIANYCYQGFSSSNNQINTKEQRDIIYRNYPFILIVFYIVRYVFLRSINQQIRIFRLRLKNKY
jgi:glycosyltransferase involved in cell wall biosynthesis